MKEDEEMIAGIVLDVGEMYVVFGQWGVSEMI